MTEVYENVIVSGDWLVTSFDATETPYRIGYAAKVAYSESWSGGVCPHVTKSIAERIITEQEKLNAEFGIDDEYVLRWDGENIIATCDGEDTEIVEPDGLNGYNVSFGWTWTIVDASDCVEVVQPTEAEVVSA